MRPHNVYIEMPWLPTFLQPIACGALVSAARRAHLRGHEGWCAVPRPFEHCIAAPRGAAQVGQRHAGGPTQQQIVRLYVAVHHPRVVHVLQALRGSRREAGNVDTNPLAAVLYECDTEGGCSCP